MIMDTTTTNTTQQQSSAYALMKRGKRGAAAIIAVDCCNVAAAAAQQQQGDNTSEADPAASALIRCHLLDNMLDILLNPYDAIGEWNNLDWLRWLMAGGKTLDEFSSAVKDYDYGTCCGLVWTANYVAYRCRTCSISPCMSLCGECFKRGDHTGHDFNMFRSQAGGACDCGDTSVMKPDGFCRKHSTNSLDDNSGCSSNCKQPPADLLRVAERIMPRLLLRLVQYLRENSKIADSRTNNTQHIPPAGGSVPGVVGTLNQQPQNILLTDLDPFLGMLHDLSALGAAMRRVMTVSLTNEKIYRWACDYYSNTVSSVSTTVSSQQQQQQQQTIYTIYTDKVRRYYNEAIHQYTTSSSSSSSSRRRRHSNTTSSSNYTGSLSNSEDDDDDGQDDWVVDGQTSSGRKNKLNHSSFLQEIVFWTVRYEFPQKMVCFLLNMLPDAAYKEALTEAFVMHYGCVARVLATTRDSDTLSNHIVHISVQLFSNEALATRMVDKLGLLRVMVSSLRRMMTKILIPSTLHDTAKNRHKVVDCSKAVMKEHCYWPLVSDLNNVLSHRPIAVKFMCDDRLLDSWFSYLSMFQGMNVNCRELGHHVEFEPNTYYAAFSAELEASAYPMWAMLSHLTSADTWPLASCVLRACLKRLRKWLIDVGYYNSQFCGIPGNINAPSAVINNRHTSTALIQRTDDRNHFTFHLPLHRYLAVFVCQAVRAQGARVEDIIPLSSTGNIADRDALLLAIATHPVRAQAAFYEIMQGVWVRNGLQIKGQAMTYIQSNFCISMVDADIYLLQLCLSELSDVNIFMSLVLEKFKAYDWMHIIKHGGLPLVMDSPEYDAGPSMESLMVFLATLVGVRTNLCSDEDYDYCQSQLEMVTLLCVSDKTHSQLMELMPERCGSNTQANTTSPNVNSSSPNLPSLNQESPPSVRDFETVLQAVAEYKRPQFEASGNMQQGLYVPLAHVWQNLYDPLHVLLRAVHRRDFQSSMDRYTTFMRSIGLLQQNQTPWPPYRMPQQHHQAYRDPRRALLSRLFHSVAWHCLYRSAVFRDVSEHTLSLLIYLLDQAWICYDSSSSNDNKTTLNLQHPMDTNESSKVDFDDDICPKRCIKITEADASSYCCNNDKGTDPDIPLYLLDRWYDSDDLLYNMCTTITHIELPPPYFHYYFDNNADDANSTTTNSAAASTMAINLFDYFTSSVVAAASAASSSSPTTVSNNLETTNSQHQQSNVPSLAAIAGHELPVATSRSSQSVSNTTRPPFYSLNAAAAATSSTMADSALNHVKQRLQFLRPPPPKLASTSNTQQQSSSSMDHLTTAADSNTSLENALDDGNILESNKQHPNVENIDSNEVLVETDDNKNEQTSAVSLNESIVSLLLRLHSHLSGKPDSYQPPSSSSTSNSNVIDEAFASIPTTAKNDNLNSKLPPCGDGAYYVGRLLDKIAKGSKPCYECIVRSRLALWPTAVVMRETATREDEERERRERKRRARDKQQQMMEEMARAQKAFLENARLSGDLDSTDTELPSQSTSNSTINMECDELTVPVDTTNVATNSSDASTSSLSNIIIDIDDNSNSSNSNTMTIKESAIGVHGIQQVKTTRTVDCVICNQTVVVHIEQQRQDPVGLVILVQGTNVLAHRRHLLLPAEVKSELNPYNSNVNSSQLQNQQIDQGASVPSSSKINSDQNTHIEENEQNYYCYWPALPPLQPQQNHHQPFTSIDDSDLQQRHQSLVTTVIDDEDMTTYASHSDRRKRLLAQHFNNLDKADLEIGALTTVTSPTPIGGNVHVQTCGHHLHLRCWSSYLASLRGAQRFNSDRGEYSCPLCRQLANSLMPLMPEVTIDHHHQHQQHQGATSTVIQTNISESVNVLTELIKQLEFTTAKSSTPSINICGGNSSRSVTGSSGDNRLQQQIPNFYLDGYLMSRVNNESANSDEEVGADGNKEEGGVENGEDPLLKAINVCVSDMIATTVVTAAAQTLSMPPTLLTAAQRDNMYKVRWHSVVSVAWTNIQVELVQRNNSLRKHLLQEPSSLNSNYHCRHKRHSNAANVVISTDSSNNNHYNMLPKRNCIAPLLKVLSVCAQSLMAKYPTNDHNSISDIWYKLIGVERPQDIYKSSNPPLLMRDPCTVLLQLVLLLPRLDSDLFDTLVKLTFNMQLFAAALKVATIWNHDGNSNHDSRHHPTSYSCHTPNQFSMTSKETQMELDDGNNDMPPLSSSSMDITESNEIPSPLSSLIQLQTPSPPLFSQAIALAKTIVFLSPNNEDEVNIADNAMEDNDDKFTMDHDAGADVPNITSEDIEENKLLLESYGRQCTLPFLRFAALLKKYTNGDDIDNVDDHHELATSSPSQSNLSVDDQMQSCHNRRQSSPLLEATSNEDSSIKNSPFCDHHWSHDDHEFLTLARYLKLLTNDEKIIEDCNCFERNYNCNISKNLDDQNNSNSEINKHTPLQLPSAMEAVSWPQWSYSSTDYIDNVSTTISQAWLTSFREALVTNIPKSIIINETSTNAVSSPASEIDPNPNAITSTNIKMTARLLLAVDCCEGSGILNSNNQTSVNTKGISASRNYPLLPTVNWMGPWLLRLPHLYDDVFQYYHGRPCHQCHGVPRETSVCLVCGTVVCLKENCCKTNNIFEAVQHSLECGGGTGMFLVVTSSSVVVIRGKRACLWGSVYLDAFGEEDRELKRGKPLYLSAERYRLLERQWLAHRFDHTNKKWVWHRDAL